MNSLTTKEWLWPGRFPLGALALVVGAGGVGKSVFTLGLAAAVSAGARWPDTGQAADPGTVLLLNADPLPEFVRPLLDAWGAVAGRIRALVEPLEYRLVGGLDSLAATLGNMPDLKLLIIDPAGAFLGGPGTRAAVRGLARLARDRGCAVVLVHDLAKSGVRNGLPRLAGSTAPLVCHARSVCLVTEHARGRDQRRVSWLLSRGADRPSDLTFRVGAGGPAWVD